MLMYCDDWGLLMQRAYMRLRIIFTELMYIQLTIIFLQKFVPLFLQNILRISGKYLVQP